MKRLMSKMGLFMAVMAVLSMTGAPSANALGGGVATGTGSITPALTTVPQNTQVTFGGIAVGLLDTPAAGTCNISFTGGGTGETVIAGSGGGTLNCSGGTAVPAPINVSCGVSYDRTGSVVLVNGSCGGGVGPVRAVCVFAPTSNPPSSYALVCTFVTGV